mmetsp:Transcript_8914/g.16029  ORF Transcript_8914/g.16029 Transcript_8914/m.16029 type:complete len:226 (-) Transcript_8914:180-857(-)
MASALSLTNLHGGACLRRPTASPVRRPVASPVRCIACADAVKEVAMRAGSVLGAAAFALSVSVGPAAADMRLPPIDGDPKRCERAFVGNTIGQANAVSDRVLDLRLCSFDGADVSQKTLSGALMSDASFKGTNMTEAVMSKAYAENSDFTGADMTNAVIDRVNFRNANLSGVNFRNAVLTGVIWDGTNLEGATFEDALIGSQDSKALCLNPTLKGDTRIDVGCRN